MEVALVALDREPLNFIPGRASAFNVRLGLILDFRKGWNLSNSRRKVGKAKDLMLNVRSELCHLRGLLNGEFCGA